MLFNFFERMAKALSQFLLDEEKIKKVLVQKQLLT
jgi:hypothetical protein